MCGDTPGRAELGAMLAVGSVPVGRWLAMQVLRIWGCCRIGGTLDGAAFYADVETARRLIAEGANPGLSEDEVRVAAFG